MSPTNIVGNDTRKHVDNFDVEIHQASSAEVKQLRALLCAVFISLLRIELV